MGTDGVMNHKVGIKLLSGKQLENVFPNYENLEKKIEKCREAARGGFGEYQKKHYQYNFMYDNVFSILGKRGTGKTSVAFTLQKKFEENKQHPYDIILPIIIPEAIPEGCTILGWILAIVKEEIASREKQFENRNDNVDLKHSWERCRCFDIKDTGHLINKLNDISQLFYAGKYNPSNESSYHKAVGNSMLQAEDYYKFAKNIADLWDGWIEQIVLCYRTEHPAESDNICPMIYFIFDDVDLAPEKIEELLSVITKYLSHPNIVVITTADEELFLEVIENRLDHSIGRLPKEWRAYLKCYQMGHNYFWSPMRDEESKEDKENDLISETARMYLGKVMPTSTRYYLRLFHTASQKQWFWLDDNHTLGEGVKEQIQNLLNISKGNRDANFMC